MSRRVVRLVVTPVVAVALILAATIFVRAEDDPTGLETHDAPTIQEVTGPSDPMAVNTTVGVAASFLPGGALAGHSAHVFWGEGSSSVASIQGDDDEATGSANHAYNAAGVYSVRAVVENAEGLSDEDLYEFVTIFDPEGEHVRGNGVIQSPAGAYAPDPTLEGPARFGFQSKYRPGASTPDGRAMFRFRVAGFEFRSTAHEWLVVGGPRAQFKGTGTINGQGSYGFFIVGSDGDRRGGDGLDRFRIKVWNRDTDEVIYDNQMGESDDSDAGTELVQGKVTIRTQGKNTSPKTTIISPPDGLTEVAGVGIEFVGSAHDEEEGDLSTSLTWTSDVDGFLFSGASASIDHLSLGEHTVTASVTDAGGLTSEASVSLSVEVGDVSAGASSVTAAPETGVQANGVDASTVTVQLHDEQGNSIAALAGNDFSVSVTGDGSPGVVSETATPGTYTFEVTNTAAETVAVTITADGVELSDQPAIEFVPGDASTLVFDQQPTDLEAGTPMSPAVTVRIEDGHGNLVAAATNDVTMKLGADPTGGAAALDGTLTTAAVDGVATFGDLSIDRGGEDFTLRASATDLTGAESASFNVDEPPALAVSDLEMQTFQSATGSVALAEPAPAGGVEVSLTSSDPDIATVPASVIVPADHETTAFTVTSGEDEGAVTVTAAADGYLDGVGDVSVALRTMEVVIDELVGLGRTNDGHVELEDPASSGGVTVELSSSDPAAVSVSPSSVFIEAGETTGEFALTGESEGIAIITASAGGYAEVTFEAGGTNTTVSIGSIPALAPGESRSLPISLSEPAPPGGLTILLQSDDETVAMVDASVFIESGSQVPALNAQVTGVSEGTAVIKASAEGFAPDARLATVDAITMSLSPSPVATFEGWIEEVRITLSRPAPADGLTVALTSLAPAVFAVPASVEIPEGQTTQTFPAEGVAVGESTLVAEATGARSVQVDVEVSPQPNITMGNVAVGEDLQVQHSVRLSVSPPEPVDITVTVASGSAALITDSRTEVGTTSITFENVSNTMSQSFWVQGLDEGAVTTLTAQAAAYNDHEASVTVTPSGFHIRFPSSISTTTFSGNTTIRVESWRIRTDGFLATPQELRPGVAVDVPVTSSDPSVGEITLSPLSFTGGGGASRDTQFDPLTAGETTVAIDHPADFTVGSNARLSIPAEVTGE